jgi:hypothetical protein
VSRPALGPTQPLSQWVRGAVCLGVKRPGLEADHSISSSAEVKECVEPYHHSPNTPSWCGAQLKVSIGTLPIKCSGQYSCLISGSYRIRTCACSCSDRILVTYSFRGSYIINHDQIYYNIRNMVARNKIWKMLSSFAKPSGVSNV